MTEMTWSNILSNASRDFKLNGFRNYERIESKLLLGPITEYNSPYAEPYRNYSEYKA